MINKRLPMMIFGFLLILSIGLTACRPTDTPQPTEVQPSVDQPEPTEEGEPVSDEPVILRVGGVKDADCWNPWACGQIYYFLGAYIVEQPFSPGKDYACTGEPLLAKSIEMSEDGMTHTFHLQEGVTFSDGTPFNAHSLVDYLDWVSSVPDIKLWFVYTANITSYEALDDLTVQITTEIPQINFLQGEVFWWYQLPVHIWADVGPTEIYTFDNYPPIGTGPFTLADWSSGEYIIFDARDDYWKGKPPVDRVVFQEYANFEALIQAFLSGEIDVINNDPPIPPIYFDTLVEAENTTVVDFPPSLSHFLYFNMAAEGIKHPAIDDVVVRQAIDAAIDKQRLIDIALLGHGTTCPNSWACGPAFEGEINPDLTVTPYDPEKARDLLEGAGYTDSDGDGVRESLDGTPLNLRLSYTQENSIYISVAELIRETLEDVGIGVEVNAMEIGTQFAVVLTERDFDMTLMGFAPDFTAASTIDFYYSCWSADIGGYAWNFAGYCNPELDDLGFQVISAATEEEAEAASFRGQELINSEVVHVLLFGQNNMQVFHNDKFEFDTDICYIQQGVWDPLNLMNLEVK